MPSSVTTCDCTFRRRIWYPRSQDSNHLAGERQTIMAKLIASHLFMTCLYGRACIIAAREADRLRSQEEKIITEKDETKPPFTKLSSQ